MFFLSAYACYDLGLWGLFSMIGFVLFSCYDIFWDLLFFESGIV